MTLQIITANELRTGAVVFYTKDRQWSNRFHSSWIIDNPQLADTLLQETEYSVTDNIVVTPYLIEVTIDDNRPVPIRYREQLRIFGPSIHEQFQKVVQAGEVPA